MDPVTLAIVLLVLAVVLIVLGFGTMVGENAYGIFGAIAMIIGGLLIEWFVSVIDGLPGEEIPGLLAFIRSWVTTLTSGALWIIISVCCFIESRQVWTEKHKITWTGIQQIPAPAPPAPGAPTPPPPPPPTAAQIYEHFKKRQPLWVSGLVILGIVTGLFGVYRLKGILELFQTDPTVELIRTAQEAQRKKGLRYDATRAPNPRLTIPVDELEPDEVQKVIDDLNAELANVKPAVKATGIQRIVFETSDYSTLEMLPHFVTDKKGDDGKFIVMSYPMQSFLGKEGMKTWARERTKAIKRLMYSTAPPPALAPPTVQPSGVTTPPGPKKLQPVK